jgi:FAD dependent oxidoreductase
MKKVVSFPGRDIPVLADADVVVAGGGPSGFAAAVTAARAGLQVILIERYGFLGGLATAGAVGTLCGLYLHHPERIEPIIEGFAAELTKALTAHGGAFGPIIREGFTALLYNPWHMKRLCDDWIEKEKNINLLLHSTLADAVVSDGAIRALLIAGPEGLKAVTGRIFVDASGDATLAAAAGVQTIKGDDAGAVMNPTMMFFAQGMDFALYQEKGMPVLDDRIKEAIKEGKYPLTVSKGLVIPTFRPGEAIIKLSSLARNGRALDGSLIADITYAELKGRKDAEIAMDFLKKEIPGFAGAFLSDTAVQVGIRETRRIVGRYVLTQADVLAGRMFDDVVCLCSWPLELWEGSTEPRIVFLPEGRYYGIPYRSLLCREINNLLVTGRAISMDHGAFASARVMGPCLAEGQAAGTACALALSSGQSLDEIAIGKLKEALAKDGARLS